MAAPTTTRERNYYDDEDVREQVADQITAIPWGRAERELFSALPSDYGYVIPEGGGWVIVKEQPHTNIPNPPLYSIWFAQPVYTSRTFKKVLVDRRKRNISWPCLKARLTTPHGELDLYPGEYVPTDIEKWLEFIGKGVTVNFMGVGEPGDLEGQMFYLQAHGIRRHDALLLLLPHLANGNFIYLTLEGLDDE